jgi:hypothetical protein
MIEQIRCAYERGAMPCRTVGVMFGLANGKIYALVKAHGWAARSEMTPCERANAARSAEAARAIELYGDAIEDVRLLRQRGFVVVREGERCRVGNTLCTLAALRAKAARERRLLEADRPSDRSIKIGEISRELEKAETLAAAGLSTSTANRFEELATGANSRRPVRDAVRRLITPPIQGMA